MLRDEFTLLLETKKREIAAGSGASDMTALLVRANSEAQAMSDDELIDFFYLLIIAGAETTTRGGSSLLVHLLSRPDQMALLRSDPSLVAGAVEELMRFESPVPMIPRYVQEGINLGGVELPAGAGVIAVTASGNRDERYFDDPDRFDITRKPSTASLGFGYGPHLCIGHYVARLEMAVALEVLLDRMPRLRLDDSYDPPTMMGANLRLPSHVQVRWD